MNSDLQNISECESVPVRSLDKESVAQTLMLLKALLLPNLFPRRLRFIVSSPEPEPC